MFKGKVIAINSNSRLQNDVMSRQGLIDKWGGDTCSNMFKGKGGLAQTGPRVYIIAIYRNTT